MWYFSLRRATHALPLQEAFHVGARHASPSPEQQAELALQLEL